MKIYLMPYSQFKNNCWGREEIKDKKMYNMIYKDTNGYFRNCWHTYTCYKTLEQAQESADQGLMEISGFYQYCFMEAKLAILI
jgi:hypothetical protein